MLPSARPLGLLGHDGDEVSARVVEHRHDRCSDINGLHSEFHAERSQPFVLCVDVLDSELRHRYAIAAQCISIRGDRRMHRRFEQQLSAVGVSRRGHRRPEVLAHRDVVFLLETQHAGIELEGLLLVIDENAGE